jgi:signal peptidase II
LNTSKKKKEIYLKIIPFLIGLIILGLDQLLKRIFILKLSSGAYIDCGICDIRLVYNTGTAFGLFAGNNVIFIYISLIAILLILLLILKTPMKHILIRTSYALILGGAISNLVDRLRVGYVIDFIDFRFWPVFNLGDTAITCGIIILFLIIFQEHKNIKEVA